MTDRTIRAKIIDILQTDDCGHKCSKCYNRQIYGCDTYKENRRKASRIMSLFKKRDRSTQEAKQCKSNKTE